MSLPRECEEGGTASKMSLSRECEEGGPVHYQKQRPVSPVPSCLSMKSDDSMIQPLNFSSGTVPSDPRVKRHRPESPVPSCLSMKSDDSMIQPLNFSSGTAHFDPRVKTKRPESPVPSCLSMKSDYSMIQPLNFSSGTVPSDPRVKRHRPESPVPSCLSMKSDDSMRQPLNFSSGTAHFDPRVKTKRPESPVPSCLSMKSDDSMIQPLNFSSGTVPSDPRVKIHRPESPVPSCLSMKSDDSMIQPLNFSSGTAHFDPRVKRQRPESPVPSCLSMKSDDSMIQPLNFSSDPDDPRVKKQRPESPGHSCLSMKSDDSMIQPLNFRGGTVPSDPSGRKAGLTQDQSRCGVCEQALRDPVIITCEHSFCRLCISSCWDQPGPSGDYACPQCRKTYRTRPPLMTQCGLCKQKEVKSCLTCTASYCRTHIGHHFTKAGCQDQDSYRAAGDVLQSVLISHKTSLKRKFEHIFEGIIKQGNQTLLNQIYTELYITEGESNKVNTQHEVWQIETASRTQTTQDTAINCNDIFKPLPGQDRHIRTVLTKGIAGIGKTVSVQKFVLDWAEGKSNQDVDFMFVLPFRELNLVKDDECSIHGLLQKFHKELKDLKNAKQYDVCKIVFIFDGMDESRLRLNFTNNKTLCDMTKTSSVDMLITNLIQGNLLPSALIWITSRPAAANQIPSQYVDQVTEVRGFNDPQKEAYFRKRFSNDETKASRIISHIKTSRSLYIMCHIPVFCWMSAMVLQQMLDQDDSKEMPKTLTEMYTHFLLIQTNMKTQKYHERNEMDPQKLLKSNKEVILKLAKLAFKQLEKGNIIFYEEDLQECGIDVSEASVYSGMCTEIFKEESGLNQRKVYCFVHLSVQEFLAAFFVFLSYVSKNMQDLGSFLPEERALPQEVTLPTLLENAVDKTLESENGHLDLFLRFLLGISLESNQRHLQGLLTHTESSSESINKTIKYIKYILNGNNNSDWQVVDSQDEELQDVDFQNKDSQDEDLQDEDSQDEDLQDVDLQNDDSLDEDLQDEVSQDEDLQDEDSQDEDLQDVDLQNEDSEGLSSESCINLFLCLLEMNDHSLYKEIEIYLRSEKHSEKELSSGLCSALAYMLLVSDNVLDEFNLKTYNASEEGHQRLIPVVRCCRKALLNGCELTAMSSETVASALQAANSHLRELDLSDNYRINTGMKLLSAGLMSPHCKLETLRVVRCHFTTENCEVLASALSSISTHLCELDLSGNDLQDSGMKLLVSGLKNPHCKLMTLRLDSCMLTEDSCEVLASVLSSSHLKELDMSNNNLLDSGVKLLLDGLNNSHCKLETLRLSGCMVTKEGCAFLASALSSNPSHLRELDLSYNHPGHSGVKLLSARLEDPHCKLEKLNLDHGGEFRIKQGLKKYACELTLDPNTAHRELSLSEGNRTVTFVREEQQYPDHPERFDSHQQVLCREALSARSYWEAEWSGSMVLIGMTYEGISRKGQDNELGWNDKSWSLYCFGNSYTARHIKKAIHIPAPPSPSNRVGVYLDWPAGTLSFYSVSSDTLTHLHTFHSSFTEPLYPGFGFYGDSSVSLCQIKQPPVS